MFASTFHAYGRPGPYFQEEIALKKIGGTKIKKRTVKGHGKVKSIFQCLRAPFTNLTTYLDPNHLGHLPPNVWTRLKQILHLFFQFCFHNFPKLQQPDVSIVRKWEGLLYSDAVHIPAGHSLSNLF